MPSPPSPNLTLALRLLSLLIACLMVIGMMVCAQPWIALFLGLLRDIGGRPLPGGSWPAFFTLLRDAFGESVFLATMGALSIQLLCRPGDFRKAPFQNPAGSRGLGNVLVNLAFVFIVCRAGLLWLAITLPLWMVFRLRKGP
jgi:hypothetical protein